ncbi:MAG: putative ABC transporter permease [Clostridiales bacterium]|nr:putative ABC transporter permease [Clostridiales bacterium]
MNKELSDRQRTIITILLLAMLGAIIGWIYEELFYRINDAAWVRRGQGGPWLPIYGFGALGLTLVTYKKKYHPLLVFIITVIGSGIIEFTTGYVLYHFFDGMRLWDYNTEIWNWGNIGGYVCIRSVAIFGIMGVLYVKWAIPGLFKLTSKMSSRKILLIFVPLLVIFIGDILFSYILRPLLLG